MRRLTIVFVLIATAVSSLGIAAMGRSQSRTEFELTVVALDPDQEVEFQLSLFTGLPAGDIVFLRDKTPFSIKVDGARILATVSSVAGSQLEMRLSRRGNGQLLTSTTGTGGVLGENLPGSGGERFAIDATPPNER